MLSNEVKSEIQTAYSRFLETRGWQARGGQKQMIAEIARTLAAVETDNKGFRRPDRENHLCIVEAGTGTGKTIAYCLAAIPIARALQKNLVISTATVALQEQLVHRDLPDLMASSGLHFHFALAKGRGRYLCPAKLDTLLEGSDTDPTLALYPDEIPQQFESDTENLYRGMAESLASGDWDGDRDNWPQHVDTADWFRLTTDHNQCAGRRCAYISQCPFFAARDALQNVEVIVANHDLVLADQALGGGAILPEPESTIFIFDEGHHLADKALQHFSFRSRLLGSQRWLGQAEKSLASLSAAVGPVGGIAGHLERATESIQGLQQQLGALFHGLEESLEFPEDNFRRNPVYRFPFGKVPDAMQEQALVLFQGFSQMSSHLESVVAELKDALDEDSPQVPKHELEMWYPLAGALLARVGGSTGLWQSYARAEAGNEIPLARWVRLCTENDNVDFEVCSSPIQSSDTLYDSLWKHCFAGVVTSATLTALNRFDRFISLAGTPPESNYLSIPSPFDFQRVNFSVPSLQAEPSDTESHTAEVTDFIQRLDESCRGCLVLFSSRRQMEDVFYQLDNDFRDLVLIQGDLSKQEMVVKHKQRIDAGKRSVLFGLASFAEGVDLPGEYCTHVIIAKLPFAVPDDPVGEAVSEWHENQGGNAFRDISVPDAAMKLLQACGRLMRNETDSGEITLLDKRVLTKFYGKLILDSLPPYRRNT